MVHIAGNQSECSFSLWTSLPYNKLCCFLFSQQITSPVQVNEFREQWPQAQIPQPQMLYQQPQEKQGALNQIPSMPETKPLTHPSNHQALQPTVQPEVESSSSSDNEQDSAQQSSSSSSPDSDNHDQEKPTSLLNYNYSAESRTDTKAAVVAVEEREYGTVVDDGVGTKEEASPLEEGEERDEEEEENSTVRGAEENAHVRPHVEQREEGDGREEDNKTMPDEKGEEEKAQKLNDAPEEKASIVPEQQPSPAEENTFEVEPSEEDKAVVEEPKVPSPPVS